MAEQPPYATAVVLATMGIVAWKVTGFVPTEATLSGLWFSRQALAQGEWYRLVTSLVAHGGPLHLAFNAIAIVSLSGLERQLGTLRYALVFLAAGVGGNLAQVLTSTTPVVGASGAIFGLLGVLLAAAPWTRLSFFGIPTPAALMLPAYAAVVLLVPGLEQLAPIAHFAHLGGLAVGVLAGVAYEPRHAVQNLAYPALAFLGVGLLVVNVQTVGLAALVDAVTQQGLVGLVERAWPSLVGLAIVGVALWYLPDPDRDRGDGSEG